MNHKNYFTDYFTELETKQNSLDTLVSQVDINYDLQNSLSKANIALGRLDANIELLEDAECTQFMFLLKEANSSVTLDNVNISFLEGLKYSILFDEYYHPPNVLILLNYLKALNYGLSYISENNISLDLIKELHRILLKGIRVLNKLPGEFKRSHNLLLELDKLQKYVNADTAFPTLLKAGIIYLSFLSIRPFTSFNGKVGRILILLYLIKQGVLKKPILFLSEYLSKNKIEYSQKLEHTLEENVVEGWLSFFLNVITFSAERSSEIIKNIQLQKEVDCRKIKELGRTSRKGMELLNVLYKNPLVRVKDVEAITGLKNPNALALIAKLVNYRILEEITGQKRNRIFAYKNYIKHFE